jgi:hypothetical protein
MRFRTIVLTILLSVCFSPGTNAQSLGNAQPGLNAKSPEAVAPQGSGGVALGGSAQLFAVINSDGTIARDKGATLAVKQGTGSYRVLFARNIRACVFSAILGNAGGGFPPVGFISVAWSDATEVGVYIETRNRSGAMTDASFHLLVIC